MNTLFFDIHTHQQTKLRTTQNSILNVIARKELPPSGQFFSIGIHPWYIESSKDWIEDALQEILNLSKSAYCKLIGEAGLDKNVTTELSKQKELFIEQLTLANRLDKPIIIHCVKAHNEILQIKKQLKPAIPMIIHGFNQKATIAQRLLANGFFISFGGAILQPNSNAAQLIADFPKNKFFLETDNGTTSIEAIYEQVAQLRRCSLTELQQQLKENLASIKLTIE